MTERQRDGGTERKTKTITTLGVALLLSAFLGSVGRAFDLNKLKELDWQQAASGAGKVAKGVVKMSDRDEIALGRETASYLCAHFGLVKDSALTRYVNLVGQTVARRSERAELPYRFGVLNTDEVNAYAAPGGLIFITKGMLLYLKDEAELAGALAHEVAHVAQRHAAKAIQKGNLLSGSVELATAAKDSPEELKIANDFTIGLLFKGYDRKDERAADKAAMDYAAQAGYSADGLKNVLARMAEAKPGENRFTALGKSHPPAKDRLTLLNKTPVSTGAVNAERFLKSTSTHQ